MKRITIILLFVVLFQTSISAALRVIDSESSSNSHPEKFNTVALVKANGDIYCTGSIIGPKLIITAKRCLIDKDISDINLFFADSTNRAGVTIAASSFNVRHPQDWNMMFPSFNIGWVKFDQELPLNYRPLPILSNQESLSIGLQVYQAGFGSHSSIRGRINRAVHLEGTTRLARFVDSPRFYNILVLKGEYGQGNCRGDNGGPAYVYIDSKWYIIGITNGFDAVLTPDSLHRTDDLDSSYSFDCKKNQSIYSFLGAHGDWIETSSNEIVWKSEPFQKLDRQEAIKHSNLQSWCEARDFGSPSWNLLKILIDKRVDQLPHDAIANFYNDCKAITTYLKSVTSIYLNYNTTPVGNIDFSSASLLPKLQEISIYEYPHKQIALKTLSNVKLKHLRLVNIGLTNINFGENISVNHLMLDKNPLLALKGIEKVHGLESLSLSATTIRDLSELKGLKLKSISLVGMNTSILLGLESLDKELRSLDLRDTYIPSTQVLKTFKQLKELKLTGISGSVDLSQNKKLEMIHLDEFEKDAVIFSNSLPNLRNLVFTNSDVDNINFLKGSQLLENLSLTFNRIQDLSIFKKSPFPNLRTLNLSVNPILNISALAHLKSLSILRLFRTPLFSELIPKEEMNCPTKTGSEVLRRFCSK